MNGTNGSASNGNSSLVLAHPTLEETIAQTRLNGASWRGALDLEAYERREEYLYDQGLAKNSGLTYWVLVDSNQKARGRDVLAGCETLRKRAIVNQDGNVQDVVAYGIGSVFTPPAFRGHGYGAVMMQKLAVELQNWQTQDLPCLFSVLYSDIGKQFYDKNGGWHPFLSNHIHLRPDPFPNEDLQQLSKPLFANELPQLCEIDEALVRSEMAKRQNGTTVALIPDHATIAWHHAREDFVSSELYDKRPVVKGAMAKVGQDRIWCIFTRVWNNEDTQKSEGNTMFILRLVVEKDKSQAGDAELSQAHLKGIASVLHMAQREAYDWNMKEVELWSPRQSTVEAARMVDPKAKLVERETESIASLRWYGAADAKVEWVENEKFGWC